jgi:hypothetical protein
LAHISNEEEIMSDGYVFIQPIKDTYMDGRVFVCVPDGKSHKYVPSIGVYTKTAEGWRKSI